MRLVGLGVEFWGLEFGVLGLGVWGMRLVGLGVEFWGLEFGVLGLGVWGMRLLGLGFRGLGSSAKRYKP